MITSVKSVELTQPDAPRREGVWRLMRGHTGVLFGLVLIALMAASALLAPWLFTGIQILKPESMAGTPDGPFSLNLVYDRLLEEERLYGVVHDGEWFHVGTPDGLAEAEAYLKVRYPGIKHR